MDSLTQKLLKILKLEAEEGHEDRAVIGGLARFADTWLHEAGAELGQDAKGWVEDVAGRLRRYSSLGSSQERSSALGELMALLEQGPGVPNTNEVTASEQDGAQPSVVPEVGAGPASVQPESGKDAAPASLSSAAKDAPPVAAPPPAEEAPQGAAPPPSSPQPEPVSPPMQEEPAGLDAPITVVSGVGEKQAGRLARLGIRSVRDLLVFIPRRYDDFSSLKPINRLEYGEDVTIIAADDL